MSLLENLRIAASQLGINGVNRLRRPDVVQPSDEIVTIADEFFYSEPKFGIDGEKKRRRRELYTNAARVRELTALYPELLSPEFIQQLPLDTRKNILELLGMWMPSRIETPEDPAVSLDPDQRGFYEAYGQWANGIASCGDTEVVQTTHSPMDFNTFVRHTSQVPNWLRDVYFPKPSTEVSSLQIQPYKKYVFNDGSAVIHHQNGQTTVLNDASPKKES